MRIRKLTALLIIVALAVMCVPYSLEASKDPEEKLELPQTDWSYLLINDNEIKKEDVKVRKSSGKTYIFVDAEVFKYAFKYPCLENSSPSIQRDKDTLTLTWTGRNGKLLEIIMKVDDPDFTVNGQVLSAGMGPFRMDEAYYIPINFLIGALDMKLDYDASTKAITVQFSSDFPTDTLAGYWSDTDINLFTEFEYISARDKSLPINANAYIYNADGTYRLRKLSADGLLVQCGKYRISGYTIIHYNISETLYKGSPMVLQYMNKLLEKPQYSFINNHYPDKKSLVINQIQVTKK